MSAMYFQIFQPKNQTKPNQYKARVGVGWDEAFRAETWSLKLRDGSVGMFILLFYLLSSVVENFYNKILQGQLRSLDLIV